MSDNNKTAFHSARYFSLEEGGMAHVQVVGTNGANGIGGWCRTVIIIDPPNSLLTDRDVAMLAGLMLGSAFAPPPPVVPTLEVPASTIAP